MADKAVIGVVTSRRNESGELVVNPNIQGFIERAGAEVRPFNYEKLRLYELLGEAVQIDGFVFPGGGDLAPSFYGQDKLEACNAPVRKWDELEMNMFPLLMQRNLPMLGICRGCQVINVGFGGTLIQDLPSQKGLNHRQSEGDTYFHKVHITSGTRLAAALECAELDVNSFHHQAIDEVADGFKVSARAQDGVIEAIESTDPLRFVMGIQWHPELLKEDPASKAIFAAFIGAVEKRRMLGC